MSFASRPRRAEGLRDERGTNGGSSALKTVAEQFDDDARRIDPSSERR